MAAIVSTTPWNWGRLESDATARKFAQQTNVVDDRISARYDIGKGCGRIKIARHGLDALCLPQLGFAAGSDKCRDFMVIRKEGVDQVTANKSRCTDNRYTHGELLSPVNRQRLSGLSIIRVILLEQFPNIARSVIVWFRQDLRLADNPALAALLRPAHDFSPSTFTTMKQPVSGGPAPRALVVAPESCRAQRFAERHPALILRPKALEIIPELVRELGAGNVFWNRCVEPWRVRRDDEIKGTPAQRRTSRCGPSTGYGHTIPLKP